MSTEKPRSGYLLLLLLAPILVTVVGCLSFAWNTSLLQTQLKLHLNDLGKFYYEKLDETAMTMPEIFQHRIQRTLGI